MRSDCGRLYHPLSETVHYESEDLPMTESQLHEEIRVCGKCKTGKICQDHYDKRNRLQDAKYRKMESSPDRSLMCYNRGPAQFKDHEQPRDESLPMVSAYAAIERARRRR